MPLRVPCLQSTIAIVVLLAFRSAASAASPHAVDVEAFAGIMADVRTASERCLDLAVDSSRRASQARPSS